MLYQRFLRISTFLDSRDQAWIRVCQNLNAGLSSAELLVTLSHRQTKLLLRPLHGQGWVAVAFLRDIYRGSDPGHSDDQFLNPFDTAFPLFIQRRKIGPR